MAEYYVFVRILAYDSFEKSVFITNFFMLLIINVYLLRTYRLCQQASCKSAFGSKPLCYCKYKHEKSDNYQ